MKLFEQNEWKLLWPHYVTRFLFGAITFTWPFFVIYYQQRGLMLTQMAFMWSLMSVAKIVLEVPTGVIADVFGRKASVFLGYVGISVGWVLIPFTTTYPTLILALLTIALFQTFVSGALDAWIYDLLKHERAIPIYKQSLAKVELIYLSGAIIGPLIGAWLATQTTLGNLFLIEGILGIFMSFIILFMREHFVRRSAQLSEHAQALFTTTKEGLRYAARHPQLKLLFLIIACFIAFAGLIQDLGTQPVLTTFGMPIPALGIFSSLFAACVAVGPFLGLWVGKRISERALYVATTLFIIAGTFSIMFIPLGQHLAVGALLISGSVAAAMQNPFYISRMQHLIPSKTRATIISTQSVIGNGAYVIAIIAGGWLMDAYGAKVAIGVFSLILIPALIAYTKLDCKTKSAA